MVSEDRFLKSLMVIEKIACHSFQEDGEMGKIYRIAHQATNPSCRDAHPEWEDELQEMMEEVEIPDA